MSRIGIVAALPDEARCLGISRPQPGSHHALPSGAILRIAGMGGANASRAASQLLRDGVDALVSYGFCGALDTTLAAGTLLLPALGVDARGNSLWYANSRWHDRLHDCFAGHKSLRVNTGSMLAHETVIASPAQKQQLQHSSAAVAVDMESATIAAVASQAGLAFISLRSVSDTAYTAVPSTALAFMDCAGRLRPLRGLSHWLSHAGQTGALLQLTRDTRHARRSLRMATQLTGPQLLGGADGQESAP